MELRYIPVYITWMDLSGETHPEDNPAGAVTVQGLLSGSQHGRVAEVMTFICHLAYRHGSLPAETTQAAVIACHKCDRMNWGKIM